MGLRWTWKDKIGFREAEGGKKTSWWRSHCRRNENKDGELRGW